LLGIPYETVPVNLLKGEQLESAEFGAVNPARGVPVVEIDGLRISQSIAIIE
jgi:maleylacetoacetate isomerase